MRKRTYWEPPLGGNGAAASTSVAALGSAAGPAAEPAADEVPLDEAVGFCEAADGEAVAEDWVAVGEADDAGGADDVGEVDDVGEADEVGEADVGEADAVDVGDDADAVGVGDVEVEAVGVAPVELTLWLGAGWT